MTEFQYSVSTDITSGLCSIDRLTVEIAASAITIALESITKSGDVLTVTFKADLSGGEETILDALVTAHSGEPMPDERVVNVDVQNVDEDGHIVTKPLKRHGAARTVVSHDFVKKCSWYSQSVRVTAETLTPDGTGLVFSSAHTFWICVTEGLLTDEYLLEPAYKPVIKVGGVTQTTGFTIDHEAGTVTFDSLPGGTVTADYSYATGSHFIVSPAPGGKFQINRAEVQFTKNIVMKKTCIEIWAYDPTNLPNRIAVPNTKRCFKSEKDVINISNAGKNKIEKFGSLPDDVWEFPFDYESAILLDDALGMQLRIYTEDDETYGIASGVDAFATVALHGDPV